MNKQWKKVKLGVIQHASLENNRAYLLRTEITKSHLHNRICQRCDVKTSTVTPSYYYVFNISLSCNINIPRFIGNLCWDLLLGNHLKQTTIIIIIIRCSGMFRDVLCSWFYRLPTVSTHQKSSFFFLLSASTQSSCTLRCVLLELSNRRTQWSHFACVRLCLIIIVSQIK